MKALGFGFCMVVAGLATQVSAETSVVVDQVQSCMSKTRAPGSYLVAVHKEVPTVMAATGGTETGVVKINDCLADIYDVQFSAALSTSNEASKELVAQCHRKGNAHLIVGTIVTAATFAAVGTANEFWLLFGAGVGGASIGRGIKYKMSCNQLADPNYRSGKQIDVATGCPKHADVMHGGSRYCR
ncbi:hypothetical protein [uncultured Shimia sp.]|uniref:hypothetical protein n=1 Tax=uncultured Shimia sp. TaxID=573152 RepID=UPI0026152E48|nr:hypothetical protein [uncultured Shimia sp.]